MRVRIFGWILLAGACSGAGKQGGSATASVGDGGSGAAEASGESGAGDSKGQAGEADAVGGGAGVAGDTMGRDGGSGGDTESVPLVELPAGSREINDVVNFVDAEAAADLDGFLSNGPSSTLTRSVNLFLEHYEEQYDFVVVFTDHKVVGGKAFGRFITITSQPRLGTGATSEILLSGFQTNGRLKGAIGVEFGSAPLSHEVAHYWAVFLDKKFGFGLGKTINDSVHWGFAGVNGELGGFDPQTLSCQTPAGAPLGKCTPMADGRYRYSVNQFGSLGNTSLPYAPLELYLMGLGSIDDVPSEVPVLKDAEDVGPPNAGIQILDAAGYSLVKTSDIVARHGVAPPLSEGERHFKSAFVVISAAPASDATMAEVAQRAAAWGDRGTHPLTHSFASDTGMRATMDTVLGPRRTTSDPPPLPRAPFACDVLQQDCEQGLACYYGSLCAIPGPVAINSPCNQGPDCAAGSACFVPKNQSGGKCLRYCDGYDINAPMACAKLCSSSVLFIDDGNGKIIASVCAPP